MSFRLRGTYTTLRGAGMRFLTDTGQVVAGSVTSDTGGGATTAWTAGSAVPCHVEPLTGNLALTASRIYEQATHFITLPPNVTVNAGDRFAVQNRGTFEVVGVRWGTDLPLTLIEAANLGLS